MALMFFESPHWVTKKFTVRDMDADNRMKAALDAWKLATGVEDHRVWEYHGYKICSPHKRTTVHLFDLGNIVEFYT